MTASENQMVAYQPNGVVKVDVRFDGERCHHINRLQG